MTCRIGGTSYFKGTVSRDFGLLDFHQSISPKPLTIPLGPFQIIFAAEGLPPVSTTPVANGKIFNQKIFLLFLLDTFG
jgi:hypothetical protein